MGGVNHLIYARRRAEHRRLGGSEELVFRSQKCDCQVMTKKSATSTATDKPVRTKSSQGYEVLVTLPDGVRILKPKSKPEHFTSRQIRSTIKKVLKSGAGG